MAPPTTGPFVRRWGAGEPVMRPHGSASGDREAMWAGHRHALADLYGAAPALAPEAFGRAFGRIWGDERDEPPPLSPERRRATARMMAERDPATVDVPLAALAAAPFPRLVLSGGWAAAFEVVCDALARGIGAERAFVPGAGHGVRDPALVARLAAFRDHTSRPG